KLHQGYEALAPGQQLGFIAKFRKHGRCFLHGARAVIVKSSGIHSRLRPLSQNPRPLLPTPRSPSPIRRSRIPNPAAPVVPFAESLPTETRSNRRALPARSRSVHAPRK